MQSTLTYILSYITQEIPGELLRIAFKPTKYNTTVEQRIISQIIAGPILLDTNLVGGKRRDIILQPNWLIDMDMGDDYNILGTGLEGSFYLIPPEAREYRNLSSVIGISPLIGTSMPGIGLDGSNPVGNTVPGMLNQMLSTRTMANYTQTPLITLEGTNLIRFYPQQLLDTVAISVMLEYDTEFMNMKPSAIMAMRELCLCATHRFIANQLRISIDESEVVAGMEIGVIKTMVEDYAERAKNYNTLLMKVKGGMHYDPASINRLISYAL